MDKREKVIKGLEYCAASCKGAWDDNNGCPYMSDFCSLGPNYNGRCVDLLCADALALLKAQKPRLLSVEEVVGYVILKRDKTLWFEFRGGIMEINTKDIVYNDFICDEDCPRLDDPNFEWVDEGKCDGVIIEEYNDTFRCWTSRPTDAQRDELKWDILE